MEEGSRHRSAQIDRWQMDRYVFAVFIIASTA